MLKKLCHSLIFTIIVSTSMFPSLVLGSLDPKIQVHGGVYRDVVDFPEYLYKIISPKDWESSRAKNFVVKGSIDESFIHLATDAQLDKIAKKFWGELSYVVLKLEVKKLTGHLKFEANKEGGSRYYHLYDGQIPLDAVAYADTEKM